MKYRNRVSNIGSTDFSSQEYSLNVALHMWLRREFGPKKKWKYLIYRKYKLCYEHYYCGSMCILEGDTVEDEWTDQGFVLVRGSATLNGVHTKLYFTLYTDNSKNFIDLAKYYCSSVRLAQENLCSGAFIVYTWSKFDNNVEKFLVRDDGVSSKLFNNNGLMLRIDPALNEELQDELALLINRYIVGKIIEEINIRHPGKVTPDLHALMTSRCTSGSSSFKDLTNLVTTYVGAPDAEDIVIQVIKACCGIEEHKIRKFHTLCELRNFISSFRVACKQPQLIEMQHRTQALLEKLQGKDQSKKQEASIILKKILYDLSFWYLTKNISCNQEDYFSISCVMNRVNLQWGGIDWKNIFHLNS